MRRLGRDVDRLSDSNGLWSVTASARTSGHVDCREGTRSKEPANVHEELVLEQIGKDPSVHTERGGDVELLAELAREGVGAELRAESGVSRELARHGARVKSERSIPLKERPRR